MLVLLSGIGPLIAWRRATAANLRRNFALPARRRRCSCCVALLARRRRGSAPALLMFAFAAFVLGAVGQEFWRGVRARRAMSRDSVPVGADRARAAQPAPLRRLHRARRHRGAVRRRGGVVGVPERSALVELRPGQTVRIGGYAITYERPTSRLVAARNGRLERIDLGARLRVRRGDGRRGTLDTYKSYFPSTDPSLGPVSRFFEGEATTEVGLRAGVRRDLWTAVAPDIGRLRRGSSEGDKVFADATRAVRASSAARSWPRRCAASAAPTPTPAAGDLPPDRLAARGLDLARRADRVRRARRSRSGRRARAPGSPRPRRAWPASRASSSARSRRVESCWCSSCVALAVLVISAPLRHGRAGRARGRGRGRARGPRGRPDAKYAEIRDAEMDFRTGKLSEADWRVLDRQLRREAVDLLHRLDEPTIPANPGD